MPDSGPLTELRVPCEDEQPAEPGPVQLVLPGVRQVNIYDALEAA